MIETTEPTHPLKLRGRQIDLAILSSPAPFLLPSRDRLPADEQTKRHVSRVGVSDTLYNSQRRASSRTQMSGPLPGCRLWQRVRVSFIDRDRQPVR
jgi:hypothetical protein